MPDPNANAMRIPATFVVGIDLGQSHDYTAIVILQRAGQMGEHIHLVRVERIALNTDYPDQVDYIRTVINSPRLRGRCAVGVDGTGCGIPVVDMLRRALRGVSLTPIKINAAHAPSVDDRGWHHVPKKHLIVGMQLAAEQRYLQVGKVAHRDVFDSELAAYRFTTNAETGHDTYGNDAREADNDDLVLAGSIGVYVAHRRGWGRPIPPQSHDLPVNVDYLALQADPAGMLERWADTVPAQARPTRTIGRDPLAGWWNQ